MSVDYASMTSGTNGEPSAEAMVGTVAEATVETAAGANVPASLGVVGYAAFALLRPVPLSEIVPFSQVMAAFETEIAHQVPAPAPAPARAPAPEPEPIAVEVPLTLPPVPEPAVIYTVGGYRPAPGPQLWGRALPGLAKAPAPPVEAPAGGNTPDENAPSEVVALGEGDRLSEGVMAVPASAAFPSGYGADRASTDRQARQVLDELSFLFDGD